jgi:hypothetical protein
MKCKLVLHFTDGSKAGYLCENPHVDIDWYFDIFSVSFPKGRMSFRWNVLERFELGVWE